MQIFIIYTNLEGGNCRDVVVNAHIMSVIAISGRKSSSSPSTAPTATSASIRRYGASRSEMAHDQFVHFASFHYLHNRSISIAVFTLQGDTVTESFRDDPQGGNQRRLAWGFVLDSRLAF